MNKQEVFKILILIESVYPHFKFRNETVLLWFQFCGNFDYSIVIKKLGAHFRSNPYPPMMGEIVCYLSNEQHFQEENWAWERKKGRNYHSWNDEYILAK